MPASSASPAASSAAFVLPDFHQACSAEQRELDADDVTATATTQSKPSGADLERLHQALLEAVGTMTPEALSVLAKNPRQQALLRSLLRDSAYVRLEHMQLSLYAHLEGDTVEDEGWKAMDRVWERMLEAARKHPKWRSVDHEGIEHEDYDLCEQDPGPYRFQGEDGWTVCVHCDRVGGFEPEMQAYFETLFETEVAREAQARGWQFRVLGSRSHTEVKVSVHEDVSQQAPC